MRRVIAVVRLIVAALVLLIGAFFVLIFSIVRIQFRGRSMAGWVCTVVARFAMLPFNIKYHCAAPEKIANHHGLIFPNHLTLWDILMLLHVAPLRFVSNADNRKIPVLGFVADAIGTIFLERKDKASRKAARKEIADAPKYPAIVVFVEGGTGKFGELRPFFPGSFEICRDAGVPFLPVAIKYDQAQAFQWLEGMTFYEVFWNIALTPGPIRGEVIPLDPVTPPPGEDVMPLVIETHRAMAGVLGYPARM
jgi:1-acyl-sn-glycerol-3-phosphate acyltransferase